MNHVADGRDSAQYVPLFHQLCFSLLVAANVDDQFGCVPANDDGPCTLDKQQDYPAEECVPKTGRSVNTHSKDGAFDGIIDAPFTQRRHWHSSYLQLEALMWSRSRLFARSESGKDALDESTSQCKDPHFSDLQATYISPTNRMIALVNTGSFDVFSMNTDTSAEGGDGKIAPGLA